MKTSIQRNRPSVLRLALVVSALVLGGIGQLLIGGDNPRWAITPYLLAVIAIAIVFVRRPPALAGMDSPTEGQPVGPDSQAGNEDIAGRSRIEGWVTTAGISLSTLFLAIALAAFALGPPNTLAWYSYGAGVILLLLSLPGLDGRWTVAFRRILYSPTVNINLRSLIPWAVLCGILLLALGARVYDLQELPAGLWFDEADNLVRARMILDDPGSAPVYVPSTALPSLFLLPIAAVIDLVGITITTGRIVSVIFGLVGIVAIFLLFRFMLGSFLGLIAAFITAVMRWDLIWSRIGMHGITTPLFAALTAYLTLRALKSGRISDFGFAGAALGLGMWFYTSFRLFPLVIGFLLLHHLLVRRPALRRFGIQVAVLVMVSLAVAAPVIQVAIKDFDEFFERTRVTSTFNIFSFEDAVEETGSSFLDHALMFHRAGDPNPRHNLPGEPMLDFFSGALLVLGFGIAFTRWRNVALLSLPFWLLFMVLPGVLTLPWEAPQSLRSIGALPAVVGMITLAIGALWWVGRAAPWTAVRRATPLALAALLGAIAFLNVDMYFGEQASDPLVYAAFSTDETLMARHMIEQQRQGYQLLTSRQFKYSLNVSMLANRASYEVLRSPAGVPIDGSRVSHGVSVYLEPREAGVFRLLKTYYPEGRFQEVRPPGGGDVLFYSVVISRNQLVSKQGLRSVMTFSDGAVLDETLDSTEAAWRLNVSSGNIPFDVMWQGTLHVVTPGEYVLALEGGEEAQVLLDGRSILSNDKTSIRIEPGVGLHSLEVRDRITDVSGVLRLLWQPPGGRLQPIPLGHLYHGPVRPVGLSGDFYQDASREESQADAKKVTPSLEVFYYDPVVPEPYFAVWEGTLTVDPPFEGDYLFEVTGAGVVDLYIDGLPVARSPELEPVGSTSRVGLSRGEHAIKLEYLSHVPPSQFNVIWTPPGGNTTPIPGELLSPAPERMFRVVDD